MSAGAESGTTSVVLDDVIFRLQQFGGASDFWREVTRRLDRDPLLSTRHVPGSKLGRLAPIRAQPGEIVHSSHFRVPRRGANPCVTTIHDLTFERGLVGGRSATVNLWQRRQSVRRADAIVCISEHTQRDLEDYYADTIRPGTIVATIHHGRTFIGRENRPFPNGIPRPPNGFVMYVGNRDGYKNFFTGIEGFALSGLAGEGIELWCTGTPFTTEERAHLTRLGLIGSVRELGVVSVEQLAGLYEHAHALLYPSRYEGFGLPPLDAMSLGCPVVGADATSVSEIVGNGGLLIPPGDRSGFGDALRSLSDPLMRAELIEAGYARARIFDWDQAAVKYSMIYRELSRRRSG